MNENAIATPAKAWGTPTLDGAKRLLLMGSGELGREVVIEAMRLGLETIAVDAYANAPAMQVAHRSHVIDMLAGDRVRQLIEQERPDLIVPEVEAIATDTLVALEAEGWHVIPTAQATCLTMNREGIRRLAAEDLHLRTSPYQFAGTLDEYRAAVAEMGLPCVVKPIMSSSGKGQSLVRSPAAIDAAWDYAYSAGRGKAERVIVEGFIPFDTEITLLTVRAQDGIFFLSAHWPSARGWRLSRIVATLRSAPRHHHGVPAHRPDHHRCPRRVGPVWRGAIYRRSSRPAPDRLFQRSQSPPPRHRHGDDGEPKYVGI